PLTVHGDGQQTRCFGHVKDVVPALVELLTRPAAFGKVFNLGSNREVSIQKLAEMVINMTHSNSEIRYIPYEEAYPPGFEDLQRRVPDIPRISRLIGFQPPKSLEDIIADVIVDQSARLREAAATSAGHEAGIASSPMNGTAHGVHDAVPGNGNSAAVKA